jgi:hypothetical protein
MLAKQSIEHDGRSASHRKVIVVPPVSRNWFENLIYLLEYLICKPPSCPEEEKCRAFVLKACP